MLNALNNIIISLCNIKWRGMDSLKIFDEKIFWATVLLALPDEVVERREDCIAQIQEVLLDKFVVRSNGIIEIWGHDVWDPEIEINNIPIGVCGILEYKQWNTPMERDDFARIMLIYPLITRLYEIYGRIPEFSSNALNYLDIGKGDTLDLKSAEQSFWNYKRYIEEIIPNINLRKFSKYGLAMQKGYFLLNK